MTPMFRAGSIKTDSPIPMYEQLANRLRVAIQTGELAPGEALPSESELMTQTRSSRAVVRMAMDVLVHEGLLSKRQGQPTIVTAPEPVRHIASSRYQEALDRLRAARDARTEPELSSGFTRDHGIAWPPGIKASYAEDMPTERESTMLELTDTAYEPVLRRTLVKLAERRAVQLQTSVYPLYLVEGTQVMDPDLQPWPEGTVGELFSIGIEVCGWWERAFSRPRTGFEREVLDLGSVPWVLEVHRLFFAEVRGHDVDHPVTKVRPVEYSVAVVSGLRYAMEYEGELH